MHKLNASSPLWLTSLALFLVAGCAGQASTDDGSMSAAALAPDPPGCTFDASDPFEPRARLPQGPYRGRCIDTREARPIVHLDAAQAEAFGGLADDEIVVANVFHDHRFWVARIPRDGVESVIFQLEFFPAIVPAGHTETRVRFAADRPVVLLGQTPAHAGERVEIRDLVFSVEAIGQLGYSYDLLKGLVNDFGAVYRVKSLAAAVDHMIVQEHHDVEQWQLQMTDTERARFLENYLDESDARAMSYMYNTLFVNCTNEIVRILDTAMTYTPAQQVTRFLAKVTEFYPNIVRAALVARGLVPLDHSTDWPHLQNDPTIADLLVELQGP